MLRLLTATSVLLIACDSPGRRIEQKDAAADEVLIDAPPPSVDAGPPPKMACSVSAPTCNLPPSTCLDSHYLVYYTNSSCISDECQYAMDMLYCPSGCVNGGCSGGFT